MMSEVSRAKAALAKLEGADLEKLKSRVKPSADVQQYLRFLALKAGAQDWCATKISPPAEVDALWHAHILDTVSYQDTCKLLGDFVHHDPDGGDDPKARAQRRLRALKMYEEAWGTAPEMWKVQEVGGRRAAPAVKEEGTSSRAPLARAAKGPATAAAAAAPAPAPAPPTDRINIKVVTQDGNETFVNNLKMTKSLIHMKRAWCQQKGTCLSTVRFFFDGELIRDDNTPERLDMRDGDVVDVMVEQGGC